MDQFTFYPVDGLEDASIFTNPTSETEVRTQLNNLHKQTRDFINSMITAYSASTTDASGAHQIGSASISRLGNVLTVYGQLLALASNSVFSSTIKNIRISADGALEYSLDGTSYVQLSLTGHEIHDAAGVAMPWRKVVQFLNSTVVDDGTTIKVTAEKGDKGDKGATGYGLITGGTINQVMAKKSANDYDIQWYYPVDLVPDSTISNKGLMTAADKIKLDGIEVNANKYTHPDTHPASIITETETQKFVSPTEKATWNAKQNAITYGTVLPSTGSEGDIFILLSA